MNTDTRDTNWTNTEYRQSEKEEANAAGKHVFGVAPKENERDPTVANTEWRDAVLNKDTHESEGWKDRALNEDPVLRNDARDPAFGTEALAPALAETRDPALGGETIDSNFVEQPPSSWQDRQAANFQEQQGYIEQPAASQDPQAANYQAEQVYIEAPPAWQDPQTANYQAEQGYIEQPAAWQDPQALSHEDEQVYPPVISTEPFGTETKDANEPKDPIMPPVNNEPAFQAEPEYPVKEFEKASAEDFGTKKQIADSEWVDPAATKLQKTDPEGVPLDKERMFFPTRRITFHTTDRTIVMQPEGGFSPLLAIVNILALRGRINLRPVTALDHTISLAAINELMREYIIKRAAAVKPKALSELLLNESLSILPSLLEGVDLNFRFSDVDAFEPTALTGLLDICHIRLMHGWLVNPRDKETASAFESQGYYALPHKVVPGTFRHDPAEPVPQKANDVDNPLAPVTAMKTEDALAAAEQQPRVGIFSDSNAPVAQQRVDVIDDVSTTTQDTETQPYVEPIAQQRVEVIDDAPLATNTQVGELPESDAHTEDPGLPLKQLAKGKVKKHKDPVETNEPIAATKEDPLLVTKEPIAATKEDPLLVKKEPIDSAKEPPTMSGIANTKEEPAINKLSTSPKKDQQFGDQSGVIRKWFDENDTQLTTFGLMRLLREVGENDLVLFFRNNAYSVMTKKGGCLYLLITAEDYLPFDKRVWASLEDLTGEHTRLVDAHFHDPNPENRIDDTKQPPCTVSGPWNERAKIVPEGKEPQVDPRLIQDDTKQPPQTGKEFTFKSSHSHEKRAPETEAFQAQEPVAVVPVEERKEEYPPLPPSEQPIEQQTWKDPSLQGNYYPEGQTNEPFEAQSERPILAPAGIETQQPHKKVE